VSAEEEFALERSQEKANSDLDLFKGETDAIWKTGLGYMNIGASRDVTDKKKSDKWKAFDKEQSDKFCSDGVYCDMDAIRDYVKAQHAPEPAVIADQSAAGQDLPPAASCIGVREFEDGDIFEDEGSC
jgi:hypothetical protein